MKTDTITKTFIAFRYKTCDLSFCILVPTIKNDTYIFRDHVLKNGLFRNR